MVGMVADPQPVDLKEGAAPGTHLYLLNSGNQCQWHHRVLIVLACAQVLQMECRLSPPKHSQAGEGTDDGRRWRGT